MLLVRLERYPGTVYPGHRERCHERPGHALRPPAVQPRHDVQRRAHLLEPRSRETRHWRGPHGRCGGRIHPPDQLRRHHAGRHRRHERCEGRSHHQRALEHGPAGCRSLPEGHQLDAGRPRLLPRRRLFRPLRDPRRHAHDHAAPEPGRRPGSGPTDCGRLDGRTPAAHARCPGQTHRPHLAHHLVRPAPGSCQGLLQGCL